MRCWKIRKLIPKYVDSQLRDEVEQEVRAHLGSCERCRAEEAEIRRVDALLDTWPSVTPDLGFASLMERIEIQGTAEVKQPSTPFGVPKWATAGMAAASIAAGVVLGSVADFSQPTQQQIQTAETPTEQQVASALGFQTFDDWIETSVNCGISGEAGEAEGGSTQ